MAAPEHSHADHSPVSAQIELTAAITEVDRRLELNDDNENTIERTFKRDELLEERDELQAEMDLSTPPPEQP